MKKFIAVILVFSVVFLSACSIPDIETISKIIEIIKNDNKSMVDTSTIYGNDDILKIQRYTYNDVFNGSSTSIPVDFEYQEIKLTDECAKKFPELNSALNNSIKIETKNSKNAYNELVDIGKDASFTNYPDMRFSTENGIAVRRADNQVLSYMHSSSSYAGGAHGSMYITGKSFDTETGKKLTLDDITSDKNALAGVVYSILLKHYPADTFYDVQDTNSHIYKNIDKIEWVMDYSGITFIFNQYEIACYAAGIQVVTVPFAEIPGFMQSKYSNIPEKYAFELSLGTKFDLDGDGTLNEISAYCNDYYRETVVTIDDNDFTIDDSAFDANFVLVHMGSGENYLYSNLYYDGDEGAINISGINSQSVYQISKVFEGLRSEYLESAMGSVEYVFTDPDCVEVGCHLNLLSTVYGHKKAYVDSYGKLTNFPGGDFYTVSDAMPLVLTLKRELKAKLTDEASGKEKGEITLNPGEDLLYYRTDNKHIADLKTMDGTVVRVNINTGDGIYGSIDGISIDQIFDGLIFAG